MSKLPARPDIQYTNYESIVENNDLSFYVKHLENTAEKNGEPFHVFQKLNEQPVGKAYTNLFDVAQPNPDGVYLLNGGASNLVLYGQDDAHVYFDPNSSIIIAGNNGNDTFETHSSDKSYTSGLPRGQTVGARFYLGSGNNTLTLNSPTLAEYQVVEGVSTQTETFNLSGEVHLFVDNVVQTYENLPTPNNIINVASDTSLVLKSDYGYVQFDAHINLTGNDTISLVSGNDTVVASGSATVFGGTGTLLFEQGSNATAGEAVRAGEGDATLYGGAQAASFFGSVDGGSVEMYAGSAGDTLVGGNASAPEAMHGGAGADHFAFNHSNGGGDFAHLIYGFTEGQDFIDLRGYTASDVHLSVTSGGDTILKLTDGTTIKLIGDSHFNPTLDIKFH